MDPDNWLSSCNLRILYHAMTVRDIRVYDIKFADCHSGTLSEYAGAIGHGLAPNIKMTVVQVAHRKAASSDRVAMTCNSGSHCCQHCRLYLTDLGCIFAGLSTYVRVSSSCQWEGVGESRHFLRLASTLFISNFGFPHPVIC